jgi:hypothetical protein
LSGNRLNLASSDAQPVLCQQLEEHDGQRDIDEEHYNHQLLAREPILQQTAVSKSDDVKPTLKLQCKKLVSVSVKCVKNVRETRAIFAGSLS